MYHCGNFEAIKLVVGVVTDMPPAGYRSHNVFCAYTDYKLQCVKQNTTVGKTEYKWKTANHVNL
jgi:hypothetical protein